ncbi:MAG: 4-hydroxy-tetrahydrodipicolinate synthase [Candidatus Bathyarchaeia archaeon]|nr:4-hydroxy-tetrahydrodipicolinate synthase [Candidatus Bathyarchaeota archaeon]
MKRFEGTYVVAVTPFKPNEELDLEALKENIDYYIENGVHGVIVCGSTSEFASLSIDEHKKVVEVAVDHVNGRVPVIAGTGACSTRQVIDLTRHAKDVGADGALIVPPFYTKPKENELYEHYRRIAESVDLPIMLYNNPFTSKIDMQPPFIAKLSELPNIEYVKESSGDITRVWRIINLTGGKMTVFCGSDNLALESFLMGARGWVCVAANIFPKHTSRLFELACRENNIEKARDLYNKLLPLLNFLEETGKFAQLAKAGLEMMGKRTGPPRGPLLPPSEEEKEELKEIIEKIKMVKV